MVYVVQSAANGYVCPSGIRFGRITNEANNLIDKKLFK